MTSDVLKLFYKGTEELEIYEANYTENQFNVFIIYIECSRNTRPSKKDFVN